MVFVDTGAWFAACVPNDPDHAQAVQWFRQNNRRLVTTDYILDETLTLLKVRGEAERAIRLGKRLFDAALVRLEWATPDDIMAAWMTFQSFGDKEWSFTDCVSREVMQRLQIRQALSFDHHFRQFGTVRVVP